GHRGGARPAPARLPRLVGDTLVPPVPAPPCPAKGAGRRRLDRGALLPPRHRGARPARPSREAGLMDLVPLFDLRLRTPRLELRLPTRPELEELRELARDGVHPADEMPFAVAWTDEPYSDRKSTRLNSSH